MLPTHRGSSSGPAHNQIAPRAPFIGKPYLSEQFKDAFLGLIINKPKLIE